FTQIQMNSKTRALRELCYSLERIRGRGHVCHDRRTCHDAGLDRTADAVGDLDGFPEVIRMHDERSLEQCASPAFPLDCDFRRHADSCMTRTWRHYHDPTLIAARLFSVILCYSRKHELFLRHVSGLSVSIWPPLEAALHQAQVCI